MGAGPRNETWASKWLGAPSVMALAKTRGVQNLQQELGLVKDVPAHVRGVGTR